MFHGRTAAQVLVTPQDEDASFLVVLNRLAWCWAQTRGPVALSEFGAQWAGLYTCLGTHLDGGRGLLGVFDLRQDLGPSQQKVMKPFQARYPLPWQHQDLVVGDSIDGQIEHDKKFVFNAPMLGYQPPAGEYDTVEEAFAAGAAVSWFGSFNISLAAPKQSNTVCLMPGLDVATMFVADIRANHDYIVNTQQQHQPYPRRES